MVRPEYGGSSESYFAPGLLPLVTNVYTDSTFTTAVTDLRACNPDGSIGAAMSQVTGNGRRFVRFYGADTSGVPPSVYAPQVYLSPGVPDPSGGAIRLDPNPRQTFGTQVDVANEAQARISAVQGISSGANPDPLGYAGQISAGRRPAFYRNTSAILSENMSRYGGVQGNQAGLLTSGVETVWAYPVVAGDVIGRVIFCSGTTGAVSPTNQWATLRDTTGLLLRISADATTAAWASNTEKAFVFNTPGTTDGLSYTASTSGFVYFGLMVAAGTTVSLIGVSWSGVVSKLTPILGGNDTATGRTVPSGATGTVPLASMTNTAGLPWMQVR